MEYETEGASDRAREASHESSPIVGLVHLTVEALGKRHELVAPKGLVESILALESPVGNCLVCGRKLRSLASILAGMGAACKRKQ